MRFIPEYIEDRQADKPCVLRKILCRAAYRLQRIEALEQIAHNVFKMRALGLTSFDDTRKSRHLSTDAFIHGIFKGQAVK